MASNRDLTERAHEKIRKEYAMMEANMDRRDIPCDAYRSIADRVIDELEKGHPGRTVDRDLLRQWGI